MDVEQLILHYGVVVGAIASIMERLVSIDKKSLKFDLTEDIKLIFFRTSKLRAIGAGLSVVATLVYTLYTGLGFWEFLAGTAVVFLGEYSVGKLGIRNVVKGIMWIKDVIKGK